MRERSKILDGCLGLRPGQTYTIPLLELEAAFREPRQPHKLRPLEVLELVLRDYVDLKIQVIGGIVTVKCTAKPER